MKLAAKLLDPHDAMAVVIAAAEGSPIVHTAIIEDDGAMIAAQYGQGVFRLPAGEYDISDPACWLTIDLPWADNTDCKAWRDATIGLKYNWTGCLFSAIRGHGLSYAGEYFCSQHSTETISRLTNGPKTLPPLACPAELVRRIRGILQPSAVCETYQTQDLGPLDAWLRENVK